MHGSGEFAYAVAEKGLIDEYEVYVNPLVWGDGNVHVLGDRGTVRMELDDVKGSTPAWSSSRTSRPLDRGWDRTVQAEVVSESENLPRQRKSPVSGAFRVAGAGFEPATSGL